MNSNGGFFIIHFNVSFLLIRSFASQFAHMCFVRILWLFFFLRLFLGWISWHFAVFVSHNLQNDLWQNRLAGVFGCAFWCRHKNSLHQFKTVPVLVYAYSYGFFPPIERKTKANQCTAQRYNWIVHVLAARWFSVSIVCFSLLDLIFFSAGFFCSLSVFFSRFYRCGFFFRFTAFTLHGNETRGQVIRCNRILSDCTERKTST